MVPHLRVNSPKTPILGREWAFSSQTRATEKHAYYQNYCIDCNQILHSNKDHQMPLVWTHASQIQDGGRPPSGKIEKSSYLSNGLSDRHEIWQGDAMWASWAFRPLKFRKFKNAGWRRPPSWIIAISQQRFHWSQLHLARWRTLDISTLSTTKIRYRSIIIDHRQICHDDAFWPSLTHRPLTEQGVIALVT